MATILHPDAAAVERLGRSVITEHFMLTRQAIDHWCRKGVPKHHRKTMAMLGAMHGVDLPEMRQERTVLCA